MAATNKFTWKRNLNGASGPLRVRGKFQAGATQAIKQGEILELSSTNWIPLDADQAMAGIIAVADVEIRSGYRAGFYNLIVPRDGDVFEYALAAASNPALGASLYWSDSQTVTVTAGTNVLGYVVGDAHLPEQGLYPPDPDGGTTIKTISSVLMVFKKAVSYYAALQA